MFILIVIVYHKLIAFVPFLKIYCRAGISGLGEMRGAEGLDRNFAQVEVVPELGRKLKLFSKAKVRLWSEDYA